MKKFLITYDVRYYENWTDQTGETCTTLEVAAKCGVIDKLNKIL